MGLTLQQHSLEDFAGFSWCFGKKLLLHPRTRCWEQPSMLSATNLDHPWPTSAQIQHPSAWNIKCQTSAFVSAAIDGASTTLAKRLAGWLEGFSSWRWQLLPHCSGAKTVKTWHWNTWETTRWLMCSLSRWWCSVSKQSNSSFEYYFHAKLHGRFTLGVKPPIPCPHLCWITLLL